jgi:hypothetical protein
MALITIDGTALPDTLGGTSFDALIRGSAGNDKLSSSGVSDVSVF